MIFWLKAVMILENFSIIIWGVSCCSTMALSTLLMKSMGLSRSLSACLMTVSVWGMIPSTAQQRMYTPSSALIALVTSPPKSTCPGVSMRLTR